MITTDYNQQAKELLNKLGIEFKATFIRNDFHFDGDKNTRDIYNLTLKRGNRIAHFEFGQSIMDSQYYQDSIQGRTYTLNGGCRTGNYIINDIIKYQNGGNKLTLIKGKVPTEYNLLASLTKYDTGTLEDFCSEFGYDTDSKKAEKIYNAVKEEYLKVCTLFNDAEMEELSEIQ